MKRTDAIASPRAPDGVAAAQGSNARRALVREQLVTKAAELFAQRSFSRTTMQDIAEELGLTRSAVYYYFRNKEEILAAIVEEHTVGPSRDIEPLFNDPTLSATTRLREAIVRNVTRKLSETARFRVLEKIESEMPDDIAATHDRSKRRVLELYCRLIEDGIRSGEFRPVDVRVTAFSVLGMTNWTAWWYSPKGSKTPRQIADVIVDLTIGGLASRRETRGAPATLDGAIDALKEDVAALERLRRGGS